MLGLRANPCDVMAFNDFGKLGIFRQETIAGVNGVGMADFGRGNNRWDI